MVSSGIRTLGMYRLKTDTVISRIKRKQWYVLINFYVVSKEREFIQQSF